MLRCVTTDLLIFFLQILFRSESQNSRGGKLSSSNLYSSLFMEQLESIPIQKVDLKYFKILFVKIDLPSLFRCSFLAFKCSAIVIMGNIILAAKCF